MNHSQIVDLYTDYLLCSFTTASSTVMSKMLQNSLCHDQITRFLSKRDFTPKEYWLAIKPIIREIENDNAFIIVDDTIEEKPFTDETPMFCKHKHNSNKINNMGVPSYL